MEIEIKQIDTTNIETLQEIGRETYYDTFASENSEDLMQEYLDSAFAYDVLKQELENPNSTFYFAYAGKAVVGYLKLNVGEAQTEKIVDNALEVQRIYVRKQYHRKGIGRKLFDFALAVATKMQKQRVWLGVWEHNYRALAFYQKFGFTRHGEHYFWMGDENQTDYIMVKEAPFTGE